MQADNMLVENMIANKYKILEILQDGDLGKSYKIEHIDWDLPLRIKCFYPSLLNNLLEHAIDRWISITEYDNIANAYYWENIDGNKSLISEFIAGKNLEEYNSRITSLEDAVDIAIQIAYALQNAHSNRLIHGNLKTENIIINEHGKIFLTDFSGFTISAKNISIIQNDIKQFGSILYYLFFGEKKSNITANDMEHANIPDILKNQILDCINSAGNINIKSCCKILKKTWEDITGKLYLENGIISFEWDIKKRGKSAISYFEKGNLKLAKYLWSKSIHRKPSSINALWNRNLTDLREDIGSPETVIEEINSHQDSQNYQILCAQAELALETGCNIHHALENIRQRDCNEEDDEKALRRIGELFYRIREFDKAIECFEKLFKTKQYDGDDWYRLAASFFYNNELNKAKEVCLKGLKENQNYFLLQIVEAVLLYMDGKINKVEEKFLKLQEKHPNTFWVLMHIAEFYGGLGIYKREVTQEQKNLANKYFKKLLQINPYSTRTIRNYNICGGNQFPLPDKYYYNLEEWSQINQFVQHSNIITRAVISPDGKWSVSGDCEGNIYLWDSSYGVVVNKLIGHTKHISALAITSDGKKVISGSWDKSIRVWDIPSCKCIWEITHHKDTISSIAVSENGRYLISGSWDGSAILFDIIKKKKLQTLISDELWVTDVAISNDGYYAIICNESENMTLIEISSRKKIATMDGISIITNNDFSMAVSSGYNYLKIWNIINGELIDTINISGKENCIAVSNDMTLLVTKSEDDIITIWDLINKRKLNELYGEEFSCADITADSNYLITGCGEILYLWENISQRVFPLFCKARYLPTDYRIENKIKNPYIIEQAIRKAEIAIEENDIEEAFELYSSVKQAPGYENIETVNEGFSLIDKHKNLKKEIKDVVLYNEIPMIGEATSGCIALNGEIALIGNDDDPIKQWNLKGNYISHRLKQHSKCVCDLAISSDGSMAISGSWDGKAILWNLDFPLKNKILEFDIWVTSVNISENKDLAIIGTKTGKVILWNINKQETFALQEESGVQVTKTGILQDNKAYSIFIDGTMIIWNIKTHKIILRHRPNDRFITAIDIDAKNNLAYTTSRNGHLLIWKLENGEIIKKIAHEDEVIHKLKIINDENFLSISRSGILKLWSVSSEESVFQKQLHNNRVVVADFNHNGRFLVSSDESKMLTFWEIQWNLLWEEHSRI